MSCIYGNIFKIDFEAEKLDAIFLFLEENFPYAPTGELVDMSYCK